MKTSKSSAREGLIELDESEFVDGPKVRRVRKAMKSHAAVLLLAETFKILGDPTRIKIAYALARQELCVRDIATLFELSESAVSHSLRSLRQMKLVRVRKDGKVAYYTLDDEHITHLLDEGFRHVEELI